MSPTELLSFIFKSEVNIFYFYFRNILWYNILNLRYMSCIWKLSRFYIKIRVAALLSSYSLQLLETCFLCSFVYFVWQISTLNYFWKPPTEVVLMSHSLVINKPGNKWISQLKPVAIDEWLEKQIVWYKFLYISEAISFGIFIPQSTHLISCCVVIST